MDNTAEKAVKMLLFLDALRGEDSTGIASVAKYNGAEVRVAKALGNPYNLFESKPFEKVMAQSHRALIGHNRYATSGGVSKSSAHPFEFDGLVGVHNGTLTNKYELKDSDLFKVDSENLYHYINEDGVDEAIKNTAGAWALVWWDKREHLLRMLRNDERPLWLCRTTDEKQLFWASEVWMLYAALSRNNIKFTEPFELKENMLHTWHIDQGGKMAKVAVRELKGKVSQRANFFTGGTTTHRGTTSTSTTNDEKLARKVVTLRTKKETAKAAELPSATYLNRTDILFQKIGDYVDGYGAPYIQAFDVTEPTYEIRLYVHAQHGLEVKPNGTTFKGNISGFTSHEGGYYKVSPWSIKDVEVPEQQTHFNHKGKAVTAKQWEDAYGVCAFCNDSVDSADSAYVILTTSGQCLCKSCSSDTEITALVSPANTVIH